MTEPQATSDELLELIESVVEDKLAQLRTVDVAKVTAFNSDKQTVDVELQIREPLPDGTQEEPPNLYNVPVAWPRGGGFFLTFPIAAGDYVLIVCSALPTLAWRRSGTKSPPVIPERHSYNGAFAMPCGYPDSSKLAGADVDTSSLVIGHEGGGKVTIKPNGEIEAGASGATLDLVALSGKCEQLWDAFTGATPVANDGGAALQAAVNTVYSALGSSVAASKVKAE